MLGSLIALLFVGIIAGFIARALVPGKDSMTIPATILLGVVGSFLAGFLGSLILDQDLELRTSSVFFSPIGAIIVLLAYNRFAKKH